MQHEEGGAFVYSAIGQLFHLVGFLVEAVRGQHEGVLQAVRNEQGAGAGDVALLDDELDDGGGGDGVKAAGGRVVEHQLRVADDGARDGDAAAHAA